MHFYFHPFLILVVPLYTLRLHLLIYTYYLNLFLYFVKFISKISKLQNKTKKRVVYIMSRFFSCILLSTSSIFILFTPCVPIYLVKYYLYILLFKYALRFYFLIIVYLLLSILSIRYCNFFNYNLFIIFSTKHLY